MRLTLPVFLLPGAWLAPALVLGQQPPDSAQALPAVEVTSTVLPVAGGTTGSGITARTARLDADALQRLAPRTLADALAGAPGVALYDDLGSGYKQTLVVRGFTASGVVGLPQGVTVFLDGVPVNEPDAGQVNFDLLPLQHARGTEIFAGTASLLGPNSLAGAINLVTDRGGGPRRGALSLGTGSFGYRAGVGNAAGEALGLDYYVGASASGEAGWRQLTGASQQQALVNVGRWDVARGAGLQVSATRSRVETAGSLPESVYGVRPDSNLSSGDFEDLRQLHVAGTGYFALGGGRTGWSLYARAHDAERFNVNQIDDPDVRGFSENRTVGAHGDWHRVYAISGTGVGVRGGAGGSLHHTEIRLFAERIDPGLTTAVESPIRKADAFLFADVVRGPVSITAGTRFDVVRIPFRNRLRPARDTTSTFARLSPRGGISLALRPGVAVFASAGRSFRAPAVIELACADPLEPCPLPFALGDDPPLAPVVATTIETGFQWAHASVAIDAAAYRTAVRDDIFLFPYSDATEPEGSTIDGYFANVARTRRVGVEASGRGHVGDLMAWHAAWGWSRATFESTAEIFSIREAVGEENEVEPGDRLPLVPDHTVTVGITLQPHRGVSVGAETRYVGERWLRGDEANVTAPLPAHTVTDLHVSADRRHWHLRAAVSNLLDRRYVAFGTFNINQGGGDILERFLTPSARRSVRVTLTRTFGG